MIVIIVESVNIVSEVAEMVQCVHLLTAGVSAKLQLLISIHVPCIFYFVK